MTDDILYDDDIEEDGKRKKRRGRRKKEKPPKQAKPAGEGEGGGLRQWLIDSYNGVFKIVIQPQLPSLRVLGFMLISFLIGLFWAYQIAGVQFYDGAPHQMREEHQDQYVIGVAASALARIYDDNGIATLLDRVDSPAERIERLKAERGGQTAAALEGIEGIAATVQGRNAPRGGNLFTDGLQMIVAIVAFVLIVNVFALLWGLILGGYYERARLTIKKRMFGESEDDKRARETMEGERRRREIAKQMVESAAAAPVSALGAPLMNKPSIYAKGRPFDDSFAIEDANDMFLGETGATTAKTIGEGQDLAAVEIWLFDKDDFVKTYTKVFVSEHGFNDPMMMSDLENRVDNPATDIAVIRPGAELTLESKALLVSVKVVDAMPGADPVLPPNSHFEGLTLQVQAWQKQGESVGAVAPPIPPAGGLPDLSSYEIGPPPDLPPTPPPPSGQRDLSEYEIGPPPDLPPTPPPSSGQRDLSEYEIGPPPDLPTTPRPYTPPPDLPPLDDDDDDPFGGTADFTPTGR